MPPSTRASHAKKRDASYIPRPPNAFILFRSSFIKSQRVPGNVEGNHSTLSKIIGKCWRALPREERERWEKEALAAQAEHRRKYPDWRFRPGSNAGCAKFRVKEAGAAGVASTSTASSTRRRVSTRESSDEQTGGARERGKGKGKVKERSEEEEERLVKIAELCLDGMKGRELEIAIEAWQDGRKRAADTSPTNTTVAGADEDHDAPMEDSSRGSNSPSEFPKIPLPLTHWYKRSSSHSPTVMENEQQGSPSQQQDQDSWCWSPPSFHADTSGLGYGSFDGDHVPPFEIPTLDSPTTDGSTAAVGWTKTSGGYLAVVQDPFLDDKRCEDVAVAPTAAIIFPREPQQQKPPSSFSSLADWAGSVSSVTSEDIAPAASSSSSAYASLGFYGDWDSTYG
ncbi:hypothetical protein AX14_000581 [Amanita brunnescens Koide BX004]|nr:hypothetical protein AX14_000581 [Amanita brunnescens Koide BX004]